MESGKQDGIQLLLAAEQEAQSIVNASKNDKMTRMKQAKLDAEKDISDFRAQREADFQRKITETSGDSGANVKRLEIETEEKISTLTSESSRINTEVVQMLMRHVMSVKT